MTLHATKTVAGSTDSEYFGLAIATTAGAAAALPAVFQAATPAMAVPAISRSTKNKQMLEGMRTLMPRRKPINPAAQTILRLSVVPRAKVKKGMCAGAASPRNSRREGSRLPRIKPTTSGRTAPNMDCRGKAERPATPSVTMVKKGPDSRALRSKMRFLPAAIHKSPT